VLQVWSRPVLGLVLALAAAFVMVPEIEAQTGKLTGVVTDQSTGAPLEGAQVFLTGTGYGALTSANGRYFILNVPPGTYQVSARRIGYSTVNTNNVQVLIDITREINFQLPSAAQNLGTVTVEAVGQPLIEPGTTGSQVAITAEQIEALPVTSIEGALALQQGFLQAPNTTDLISYTDSRRNAQNPIHIRGGRGGETLMLIDGVPVQNFIFGGPALSLSPKAFSQINLVKGGIPPEYGNALSGVIDIATKEGGTDLAGALEYQTSRLGGAVFDNEVDALQDYNMVEGFLSGPVPGTQEKLRFMVSARQELQADAVHEYDDDIYTPSAQPTTGESPAGDASIRDLFPGWRSFGYNNTRQVFGKLSYLFQPQMKLGITLLDNQRQRKPFDPQYLSAGEAALSSPAITNTADSVAYIQNLPGSIRLPIGYERLTQNSINSNQRLFVAKWDHTLGRTTYKVIGGVFQNRRTTCNYFQGVCLEDQFGDPNFSDDQFIAPRNSTCASHPTCGTDQFFGGEKLNTQLLRSDIKSQVTDHHEISAGVLYQRYDFSVDITQNVGTNDVNVYRQTYSNTPYDLGTYIQDRIEYDFLTVKLGARFDYGKVPGVFFADPLDPTNGTTALDVCQNPSDPRWANGVEFTSLDPATGQRVTETVIPDPTWAPATPGGVSNCAAADFKVAGQIAAFDDFESAKARKQFSPRIGVSFPLSQSSAVFFNFGRYSQNPLLNNLLTNTGIGTPAEGLTVGPVLEVPGEGGPGLIGNPNLKIEQATTYEVGYNAEFAEVFGIGITAFNKNQTGLTGVRTGGQRVGRFGFEQVFDPGTTYGSSNTPSYSILVNQDYQTVRGIEVQLRRRLQNYWRFDINYSYSRARTNASDPEREFERLNQADPRSSIEIPSDIDQAHVFNASLITQVGEATPDIAFIGPALRNFSAALTWRAASGLPYTPIIDYFGFGNQQLGRNEARAPSTSQFDMRVSKGFNVANIKYSGFVQVTNLLDKKNCIQVFNSTGTCERGAIDQSRRRQGNTLNPDVATSTFEDRAYFFGARRQIFGGLNISF
jgi:outer membrane receptor protein involved in Fe transport